MCTDAICQSTSSITEIKNTYKIYKHYLLHMKLGTYKLVVGTLMTVMRSNSQA